MALMYDRMLRNGWNVPGQETFTVQERSITDYSNRIIQDALQKAEVIKADNVAHYFYEVDAKDDWDLKSNFPNIAPPFERCWIEWEVSKHLHVDDKFLDNRVSELVDRMGALVIAAVAPADQPDIKWGLEILMFSELASGIIAGPIFDAALLVGPNGQFHPISESENQYYYMRLPSHGRSQSELDNLPTETREQLTSIIVFAYPALLTFCFLHCKNVDLITNNPPPKLSHAYQKRHKQPLVQYKTLDIQPIREILKREGDSEKTGLKMALHICRGHFKDFSKGKGLFGRYKGMYWWESQVRGSGVEGIVVKDYRMKRP